MALLVGIFRGSAVALTACLTMSAIVFLLLPEYSARLASGRLALPKGLLLAWSLTAVASASFHGELQGGAASRSPPAVAVRGAEPAVVGIKAPTALARTDARADQLHLDHLKHLMQARRRRYGRIATFNFARFCFRVHIFPP